MPTCLLMTVPTTKQVGLPSSLAHPSPSKYRDRIPKRRPNRKNFLLMEESSMLEKQTAEVIRRFNEAFQQHDPGAFTGLIAEDCVLENTGPAPDGARHVGREAALAVWTALAGNPE